MQPFPLLTLTESDFDQIVIEAGGVRAHPDADRRDNLVGADYIVGDAVIELKMLDEEGLEKPERQAKLAELFLALDPERPVVVLDPENLSPEGKVLYRRAVETPIKTNVAKSKKQLAQSREEFPGTAGSILWIFNSGYISLDHDQLEAIVANRVRQDTSSIDGVIVSGCYYHSDGFEGVVLWPCTYIAINAGYAFGAFEKLQRAFHDFSERFMTEVMRRDAPDGKKLAVSDVVFDLGDVRYVRPAPPLGSPSDFYVRGRPRANSSGIEQCPPVALLVAGLNRADFEIVSRAIGAVSGPLSSCDSWTGYLREAAEAALPLKPLVTLPVAAEAWLRWCLDTDTLPSLGAINRYVTDEFNRRIHDIIAAARERKSAQVMPSRYVLVITEEIGQDRANDVSRIGSVRVSLDGQAMVRPLADNLRIFHERALSLAAAYALAEGVEAVMWDKDRRYCWQ